jgi:Mrp family chromosome partitioning ATPase
MSMPHNVSEEDTPAPSDASSVLTEEQDELAFRLSAIRHKVLVMSGKGGVGKSTVAVNIAVSLAREGLKVGLLDVDIHGPSIPELLNLHNVHPPASGGGIDPVWFNRELKVMSIGFLLPDSDSPVIWRGPLKMGIIKQFLRDVNWGNLDFLIIDSPPGTGDEPLSVCQLVPDASGAVIVTTPQRIATVDVRKSIQFCRRLHYRIIGVIENMSGLACPHCGQVVNVFSHGGGEAMARDMGVPFLGRIPLDPAIVRASDSGSPFLDAFSGSKTAEVFRELLRPIRELP